MNRTLLAAGVLLVLLGLLGFLAAAVALAGADDLPDVRTPAGVELQRPEDDPQVLKRRSQAEKVVFASILTGGAGGVLLGVGWWRWKRQRLSR